MKGIILTFLMTSLTQSISAIELNSLTEAVRMVPDQTLVYKTVGERELHLYAFLPQKLELTNSPSLLCIHGGGWRGGEPRQFFPHCRYFALRGIPAFSIEYRLVSESAETTIHDCLSDCDDAVAFARAHAIELGLDSDRIAVMGDSAGGHLAASLGTLPYLTNHANAVINCNGIMDLMGKWIGIVPYKDPIVAESLSPLFNISSNTAPMLHIHSLADTTVDPIHAENMHAALTNSGIHSELHWLSGARHAFILPGYTATQEQIVEGINVSDRFLKSLGYLSGEPTIAISTITTSIIANAPPRILLETNTISSLPLEIEIGTTPSITVEMEVWLNSETGTLMARKSFLGFTKRGFNLSSQFQIAALGGTKTLSPAPPTGSWHNIEFTIGFSNALLRTDGNTVLTDAVDFAYPQEGRFLSIGDGLDGEIRNARVTAPSLQTTNGTPIAWLQNHDLTTDTFDPDSDGYQTLEEYIAATNPTNGLDYPHLELSMNNLIFATASNRLYEILSTDNLASNHWDSVTNFSGTGIPEALPLSTNHFYQLRISIP